MLDTVNFKLTQAEVEGVDFLNEITPYLNPEGVAFHDYNGQQVVTGKTGNLSVSISPYQVRVKDGSLCKWMLGDNYQVMGRADIKRAVERLSDTLHLPMDRAIITRLDVGLSIPVREPTANYFNHLGVLNYAQRLQQPHSLYYHRHRQAERLCFYDKNREQHDNREEIPIILPQNRTGSARKINPIKTLSEHGQQLKKKVFSGFQGQSSLGSAKRTDDAAGA